MKVSYSQVFDTQPLRKTHFFDLLALAAVPMMEHCTGTACVVGAWGTQPGPCHDRMWLPVTMSRAQAKSLSELESRLPMLAAPVTQTEAHRFYSVFFQINEGPPWVPRLIDEMSAMAQRRLRATTSQVYRTQFDKVFPNSKVLDYCTLVEREALLRTLGLFDRISELAENRELIDSPIDQIHPINQGSSDPSEKRPAAGVPAGIDPTWFRNGIPDRSNSQGLFQHLESSQSSHRVEPIASFAATPLEAETPAREEAGTPASVRPKLKLERAAPEAAQEQVGEVYLTSKEVAEKLSMSESTVYNRMNKNTKSHDPHFPLPRKVSNQSRWLLSEVETYMRRDANH